MNWTFGAQLWLYVRQKGKRMKFRFRAGRRTVSAPAAPVQTADDACYRELSDIDLNGNYRVAVLEMDDDEIRSRTPDGLQARVQRADVEYVVCRVYVGNGQLEAQLRTGRRIPLIRFTKTLSDRFQAAAETVNQRLGRRPTHDAREKEGLADGPADKKFSYRCPNCDYPLLHQGDVCPKCVNMRSVLLRLARYVVPYWKEAVLGLLLALLLAAIQMMPGVLLQRLIDGPLRVPPTSSPADADRPAEQRLALSEPVAAADRHAVGPARPRSGGERDRPTSAEIPDATRADRLVRVALLVAALLLAFVLRSVTIWARTNIMGRLGAKLMHDIRAHLYRALQRLSLSFYDSEHSGRIMSRVNEDTNVLRNFVAQGFQQLIVHVLTILVLCAVMFWFHWRLALLTLLPMPLMVVGTYIFAQKARNVYRRIRRKSANLLKAVQESVAGVYVVKSFAQEEREIDSFGVDNRAHRDTTMESVKLLSLFQPSIVFLAGVGMLSIYSYGSYLVIGGELSVGVLVMFNAFLAQFFAPIQQLSQLTDTFQRAAVSGERVFSVIDTPTEVADAAHARSLGRVAGRVQFQNVDFSYQRGEPVLRNIDMDVQSGEIIGLVGQTGSGKSTIVKLLARFYDPVGGRIMVDGHDLRELKTGDLRRNIGMVLQETFLFTGTLRENIAYGNPEADLDRIIEAARAANAHEFIMDLPDAYDTAVGERGVGLSGGEKQRIAIARAILKDPAILILDEATSSVDTATEAMIQEALNRLMKGRTTFAIAHRLSTLQNADRLIVLQKGRIIETGTHGELLRKETGLYRTLVEIQDLLSKQKTTTAPPPKHN
jgi:ATP-binding cassette, subfamily B, bacterial